MAEVLLSGFADESSANKSFREQLAVCAALGLRYLAVRFLDAGQGTKNAMDLSEPEWQSVCQGLREFDLAISSLGSPLGKVKLLDLDDGTSNRFVPWDQYLDRDVVRACEMAHRLGTRLVRGFSFYPPRGTDPREHLSQTVDQLGRILDVCRQHEITYGLEVEANLVGCSGSILAEIHHQLQHPALVLIFDAANLVMQGYTAKEVLSEFQSMLPGLGWLHVKDYQRRSAARPGDYVPEDEAQGFVPAGQGDGNYREVLRELAVELPQRARQLQEHGAPGIFLELEPHLRSGGQFGGYSGPDGFGVALRALCQLLDDIGISYSLRSFADLSRGGPAAGPHGSVSSQHPVRRTGL